MSKKLATAIKQPDTFIEDTQAGKPDATELRRREIVRYVCEQLGPDLSNAAVPDHDGMTYGQAAEQSVSTGCYDSSWAQGDFRRVDEYITALKNLWVRSQGDISHILAKVQHLLAFGSDEQKEQLKALLDLA